MTSDGFWLEMIKVIILSKNGFDTVDKLNILRVQIVNQAHPSLNVEKYLEINESPFY